MRTAWVLFLLVFVCAVNGFGQAAAINGQIEGTVTDATAAVVPGAKIGITNNDTGFARTAETDSNGFFRFTVLPLGAYTLKAEAKGFQPATFIGLAVTAGATVTVNVPLGVQAAATTVE